MFLKLNNGSEDKFIFTQENINSELWLAKPVLPKNSIFYLDGNLVDSVKGRKPIRYEEFSLDGDTIVGGDRELKVQVAEDHILTPRDNGKVKYYNFLDNFDIVMSVCFDWDGTPFSKRSTLFSIGGRDGNSMPDSLQEFSCTSQNTLGTTHLDIRIGNKTHKNFIPIVGKNKLIIAYNPTVERVYIYLNGVFEEFDATAYKEPQTQTSITIGGYRHNDHGDNQMGFGNKIYNFYIGKYTDTVWELEGNLNKDFVNLVAERDCNFDYEEVHESKPLPHSYVGTTENGCMMLGNFELIDII